MGVADRFWSRVNKSDGCWLWTGGNVGGYGRLRVRGKKVLAHRLSWVLRNGTIPDGLNVLHTCDTPACVRPEHLFLGTHQDNMRDRDSKGRCAAKGKTKITDTQRYELQILYATKLFSCEDLAKEYPIAKSQIHNIVRRI